MKDMNEPYDDLRRRLKQYTEDADIHLWNSIISRVEEENRPNRPQKKMRSRWIFLFGLSVIGGLYLFVDPLSDQTSSDRIAIGQKSAAQVPPDAKITPKLMLPLLTTDNSNSSLVVRTQSVSQQGVLDGDGTHQVITMLAKPSAQTSKAQFGPAERNETAPETIEEIGHSEITKELIDTASNGPATLKNGKTEKSEKREPDNENHEGKKWPFSIYFTIMPTLGYQRIVPNGNDNLIIEGIDRIETFSMDRLGVRAELGAEYPVSNRINIFGGIVYFQRKQEIGYTEKQVSRTVKSEDLNGGEVLQPEFIHVHKSFEYEVRNLGLQVGVSYQLSRRKLLQTVGTGMEFHVALNKFREMKPSSEFTNNPSVYVFYNLYYRLQYPTDTKLKGIIQPTLNYSFYIDENANAPFYVKPYGLGLNLGFTYNF